MALPETDTNIIIIPFDCIPVEASIEDYIFASDRYILVEELRKCNLDSGNRHLQAEVMRGDLPGQASER